MSFLSPWFLIGLIGVAVPIYLHLYFRKKPIRKDFPSLRLIKLSVEFVARRKKMRNILLLLLRCAAIILVVMALARPFIGQSASAKVSSGTPTAFIVLLDNSMSMGSTHQGISVFNTARSRALDILDQMEPGDRATVGFVNDPGGLIFSQLTWDSKSLKKAVANAPLSMSGTNIASSLLPALKLLTPLKNYRRAIYVVTDMTESAWKPFIEKYDLEKIEPSIDLIMVPVGDTAPENMAITELSSESPMVTVGKQIPLKISLTNHSQRGRKTRLSVSIDGERKIEKEVEIEANATKDIYIETAFTKVGTSHVLAEIQNDSLPSDDRRHLALKVFESSRILLIKPDTMPGQIENREELFVKFALNPLNRSNDSTFNLDIRTTAEVRSIDLNNYSAVFLINQRHLEKEFIKNLSQYLISGGNLVTFLGDRVEPEWYNKNLTDDMGDSYLLPARIFKRVGNAVSRSVGYQMTDIDMGHPAFNIFARDGNGDPSRAQIFEFFQVRPNPRALLLSRMSHGLPGIIEEKRGLGRSLLITFSADTSWSNWPIKPTWLPFLHQILISMITGNELAFGDVRPGIPVSATIREQESKELTLERPDKTTDKIAVQSTTQGLAHFTINDTEQSGFYKITGTNNKLISAFAVNPPVEESFLERINLRKIPRFIPLSYKAGQGNNSVKKKVSQLRDGYDLSYIAMLILILIVIIECWFANLPQGKDQYQRSKQQ